MCLQKSLRENWTVCKFMLLLVVLDAFGLNLSLNSLTQIMQLSSPSSGHYLATSFNYSCNLRPWKSMLSFIFSISSSTWRGHRISTLSPIVRETSPDGQLRRSSLNHFFFEEGLGMLLKIDNLPPLQILLNSFTFWGVLVKDMG